MILYDINDKRSINFTSMNCISYLNEELHRNTGFTSAGIFGMRTNKNIFNISIEVDCLLYFDYFDKWLQSCISISNFASAYKRNIYLFDNPDFVYELKGCLLKSIEYNDCKIKIELIFDHYTQLVFNEFPHLLEIFRDIRLNEILN